MASLDSLQHRHLARQPAGAGRHTVEPGRAALWRAVAAGIPAARHAGRRGRPGRSEIRRRRHRLYRRLDRASADPVRRRPAHAACHFPQRARAGGDAGNRRRADHRAADRAGRQLVLGICWIAGAAGRRRGRLDRRGGGVLADQCTRIAAAAARARDAGGRIRHQRSVRGLPHDCCWWSSCWPATRAGRMHS